MKNRMMLAALVAAMSFGLVLCGVGTVFAGVSGPCSDCHTMHFSQNGVEPLDAEGNSLSDPSRALTKGDCVGCHTGPNVVAGNIPYIHATTEPTYTGDGTTGTTLAGGSFYYVTGAGYGDSYGHNVVGIDSVDGAIGQVPPGFVSGFNAKGDTTDGQVGTDWANNQLTCAGTYGCHGSHANADDFTSISGAHHEASTTIDGSTTGKSYRFLWGILGGEASDWELDPTSLLHNQYYGVDKASDAVPAGGTATQTISFLCAECHGNFHSGAGDLGAGAGTSVGSAWLRHPTDYDMGNVTGKEYGSYGGSSHTYSVIAPVGSTGTPATVNIVFDDADDAIVTCISCHRAHGTPNADLLRWNYDMDAGAGTSTSGCFICHTTKDDGV